MTAPFPSLIRNALVRLISLSLVLTAAAPADTEDPTPPAEADATDETARIEAERKKAIGEELGTITAAGRTYNKAVITGVDDVGIRIRHETGMARIAFTALPYRFKTRFGYDREAALQKKEAEARAAAEHAKLADEAEEQTKETRRIERAETEAAESKEEITAALRSCQARLWKMESGIKSARDQVWDLESKARAAAESARYTDYQRGPGGSVTPVQRVNRSKERKAEYYQHRADKVKEQIEEAEGTIRKLRTEIRALERKQTRLRRKSDR